jgi:SAM-dependent methyltransferase
MLAGADTFSSAMSDATNYIGWILDSFKPYLGGPVLEIGVGHGSYAAELCKLENYLGIDIDANSVAEARQRFPDLRFEVADITDPQLYQHIGQTQTIVCFNVLEHVEEHDIAITNLARILVPGGHLLVIVPAFRVLYNDLDRLAGHFRRYRSGELRALFESAGLEVLRSDYFNPIGGLGWFANRLLSHKSLNDNAVNSQIALFDRWVVPISRLLDPATRSFFGQSVRAVGRKR